MKKKYLANKMKNPLEFKYTKEKLNILCVTIGLNDGTLSLLRNCPDFLKAILREIMLNNSVRHLSN